METKLCQSCAMPMNAPDARYGTEKDGTLSTDYCSYCYQNGAFTQNMNMDEMIRFCLPFEKEARPALTEQALLLEMYPLFRTLKRWR